MTDVEIVRFKIGDSDSALIADDAVIQSFIDRNGGDLDLAAAEILEGIAADAVLLDKAVKIGNYSHDRKGLVDRFLKMANVLREAAASPAFGTAEVAVSDFARDTIIRNKSLRGL